MAEWPADKIVRVPVEALIPYARNARTHSDEQVARIAASMREWGWTSPILIDENMGIIAGHGRVLAARKLGLTDVPAMVAEGWSEAQKRAYVLADNQLALNAGWDADLLKLELDELQALDFDLGLIGFPNLDALLMPVNFEPGTEDDQGKLDELVPKMVCCPGCGHTFDSRGHEQS